MIPSSLYCSACGAANATDRSVCFACQRPLQTVASENVALLQGRYRVLTQVGNGGFGAVYRAEDMQDSGNIVAIKQINLHGLTPQETIEATDAFNREISLLSNLAHPNLPRIYDHFTDSEHWYLVMDFIEGETLEDYLEAKGPHYTAPLNEVLTLGIGLCTVLGYLHSREPTIIFRDLKPANIMRTPMGKLYLIDFGIARSFKPGKLKDTIPFGSPGYAAPEQYGKAQTTPRADIYSLGALLHRLITGDDPVDNPFHFAPLRIYGVPGLSDLEALILRMVQVDTSNRPATVIEVQDELHRIANMQPTSRIWYPPIGQTPPSLPVVHTTTGQQQISALSAAQQLVYVPSSQRKPTSRRKFLIGGAAIAGLTVIGVGGIANIVAALGSRTPPLFDPGSPPTIQPSLFGAQQYTYVGHSKPVRDVVCSTHDAFLASASDDGTVQVWTINDVLVGGVAPTYKTYTPPSPATYLAWSGDQSHSILALSSGKTIIIWDTDKSTSQIITAAPSLKGTDVRTAINTFAWSSDNKYIALPTQVGVQIYDIASRAVVTHIEFISGRSLPNELITSLSWSFDGKYVAVGIQANKETIILDVAKKSVFLRPQDSGGSCVTWSPDGTMLATVDGTVVNVTSIANYALPSASFTLPDNVTALSWSDDSKFLALATEGQNQNLYLRSLSISTLYTPLDQTGTPTDGSDKNATYVNTSGAKISSLSWSFDNQYIAVGTSKAIVLLVNTTMLSS